MIPDLCIYVGTYIFLELSIVVCVCEALTSSAECFFAKKFSSLVPLGTAESECGWCVGVCVRVCVCARQYV